ncbi:MAG: hypothetical protein GY726_02390 [Proteobacteria bacterium]|nr:hypothetical protein [Pseudomonadota bacterium]
MKKALAIVLTTSLLIAGCASTDKKEEMAAAPAAATTPAIAQAKADLDAAIAAGAQWRIIDKATGSTAVDLTKLLKVAEEKATAGETDEANRIAARVSEASKIGIEQSKRYAGTAPYYN